MRLIFSAARWLRTALMVAATAGLAAFILLVSWARQVVPADGPARFSLDSDETVAVNRADWIIFRPQDSDPPTGLIFYPGGKAQPAAYAPVLNALAARGFLVVLCPMPLNLALLGPECATKVMATLPEVQRWVISGHSLGGVVAAEFAERHPTIVSGLVLWAAYPAGFTDLSQDNLPTLVIYGTADQQTTPADIQRAQNHLPARSHYIEIPGGDHWGFGNFDPTLSIGAISRDAQQAIVLNSTQDFLDALSMEPATPGSAD